VSFSKVVVEEEVEANLISGGEVGEAALQRLERLEVEVCSTEEDREVFRLKTGE